MLKYKDKALHELDLKEVLNFEKEVLNKILKASGAGMSGTIIDQMNYFLEEIRYHKSVLMRAEFDDISNNDDKELIIGEPVEQELSDSDE